MTAAKEFSELDMVGTFHKILKGTHLEADPSPLVAYVTGQHDPQNQTGDPAAAFGYGDKELMRQLFREARKSAAKWAQLCSRTHGMVWQLRLARRIPPADLQPRLKTLKGRQELLAWCHEQFQELGWQE